MTDLSLTNNVIFFVAGFWAFYGLFFIGLSMWKDHSERKGRRG